MFNNLTWETTPLRCLPVKVFRNSCELARILWVRPESQDVRSCGKASVRPGCRCGEGAVAVWREQL